MIYQKKCKVCKKFEAYSASIEEIESYGDDVIKGKIPCKLPACPNCNTDPSYFKRHELRKRQFYGVTKQMIKIVISFLIRWKCSGCGKTFTQYPNFALPYKRYTLPTIAYYCQQYLKKAALSYRKLIKQHSIGYEKIKNKEVQLSHTTIHRWITTLGGYCEITRQAQKLILEKNPSLSISRDLSQVFVHPSKYVSKVRKYVLIRCLRLFHLEALYKKTFDISIFPNLATLCFFT